MSMHSPILYRRRRQLLEQRLQEIIDLLDLIDGDPDLEPSLGWTTSGERGGWEDREPNGDEGDFDGGENDGPGLIYGGLGL